MKIAPWCEIGGCCEGLDVTLEAPEIEAVLRPIPVGDEVSAPFWEAANAGRLDIQRCARCRRWNHAPSLACPSCGSEELAFETVSGRGTLFTWCVLKEAPAPGFKGRLPLVVAIVELDEQPHLLVSTNIVGADEGELRLGLPVAVEFDRITPDCAIPQFRPVRETPA